MNKKLLLITLAGIFASCTLNEPKLPKWDTEWRIYLPTYDYNMAQAIEDEENLLPDTTNNIPIIKISVKDTTDEIGIDEKDLGIKPDDRHASKTIDDIVLNDPPEAFTDFDSVKTFLENAVPGGDFRPGIPLPPFDTTTVTAIQHIILMETFNYIRTKQGEMYLRFYHDMFLAIRPNMTIRVYDDSISHYIGTFIFSDSIKQGQTAESNHLNLAGKFMSNKLRLEYSIPLAGSDTVIVLNEQLLSGKVRTGVMIRDLKVQEANALIPGQTFTDNDGVDITGEDENRVKTAVVQRGGALIHFKNSLPLSADLQIKFLNLTIGTDTLSLSVPIDPKGEASQYIDFRGAELSNYKNPGSYIDSIFFEAQASIDSTEDYVSIMGTDSFAVTVEMDSVFMEFFDGYLDTIDVDIDPVSQDGFDFFKDIEGNIRLEDLQMVIDFYNDFNFDIAVNLDIVGYRRNGNTIEDSVHISLNETIKKSSVQPVTTLILDGTSSSPSIVDLLEILPTEIRMFGSAQVYGEGSANITDIIQAFYRIESPLSFNITNDMYYELDTDTLDIDQDTRDRLMNDTYFTNIGVDLENGLPVNADIVLVLASDSTLFDTTITALPEDRLIISAKVSPGTVGADGYVSSSTMNNITVELDDENLQIFNARPIYFKQWVKINRTNGTIRFRQTDEIKVAAVVHTKFAIDPEAE